MSAATQQTRPVAQMLTAAVIAAGLVALMVVVNPVPTAEEGKVSIIVSILPQAEFAEAVGGDHVNVTVMVQPGREPHTYAPTPSQMMSLERADLYFEVGAGLEFELVWMPRFVELNDDMLVVNGSKDVRLMTMEGGGAFDPHIWLSPKNAMTMVQNLYHGLIKVDPANASDYENNTRSYLQRLDRLDQNISAALAPLENRNLLALHPAWGYFAKDYGLTQRAIEVNGKEPTALGLAEILDFAKEYNISVVFAEPQFSTRTAESIADEIGGAVVIVDDLARDYIDNLEIVAVKIAEGLSADG
jgi:zinc transport system substrate-binding protein